MVGQSVVTCSLQEDSHVLVFMVASVGELSGIGLVQDFAESLQWRGFTVE